MYTARKTFTYNGTNYGLGDIWEPKGFSVDRKLVDLRFVLEALPIVAAEEDEGAEEDEARPAGTGVRRGRGRHARV